MSTRRHTRLSKLVKGPNGRNKCRFCSTEVAPPRRTFCSDECVHQHRLRADRSYAAGFVFERDAGICAICSIDTVVERHNAHIALKGAPVAAQSALKASWKANGWPATIARVWYEVDHIVPVCEGGGECGLENLRTLCRPCHLAQTKQLAARRKASRKTSK